MATLAAGGMGLLILAGICRPFNALRTALLAVMTVGFAGAVLLLPQLFFLVALTTGQLLTLGGMLLGGLALMLLCRLALNRLWPEAA